MSRAHDNQIKVAWRIARFPVEPCRPRPVNEDVVDSCHVLIDSPNNMRDPGRICNDLTERAREGRGRRVDELGFANLFVLHHAGVGQPAEFSGYGRLSHTQAPGEFAAAGRRVEEHLGEESHLGAGPEDRKQSGRGGRHACKYTHS